MAKPDCTACGHVAALHNVRGCRLNGCRCPEYGVAAVMTAQESAPDVPGDRIVLLRDAVLFGLLAAVMGLGVGFLAGTVL